MFVRVLFFISIFPFTVLSQQLPVWNASFDKLAENDWLVKPVTMKAAVYKTADTKNIILYNGLVKRTFRISLNVVCVDYKNMVNGQQLLRAIKPEARITIN